MLNIIFDMFSKITIKLNHQMILKEKLIFLEVQNKNEVYSFLEDNVHSKEILNNFVFNTYNP